MESLFGEQGEEAILHIVTCARNIPDPTPNMKTPYTRLDQCRNQDNNPDSLAYKRKQEELVDDDLLLEDHTHSKQEARMDR